jgi:hypothetical protein
MLKNQKIGVFCVMVTRLLLSSRMLSYAMCYLLVVTFILVSIMPATAVNNGVTAYTSDGNKFTMNFTKTVAGPHDELMTEAVGQGILEDETYVASLTIDEITKTFIALNNNDEIIRFSITPETLFLNNGKAVPPDFFKVGDNVIVSSKEYQGNALCIQNGPILYLFHEGHASPVFNNCLKKAVVKESGKKIKKTSKKKTAPE